MSQVYDRAKDRIFATAKDVSGNRFNVGFLDGYVYAIYPMGHCYKILDSNWFPSLDDAIADCQLGVWNHTFTHFQLV